MISGSNSSDAKLTLLGLPDDLLRMLASREYLTQTELVELACTCKAAAAVAIPGLYTDVRIESSTALPRLATTLQDRPELARLVKSIQAGTTFVILTQFATLLPEMQKCQPYAKRSALAPPMSKVSEVCGPFVANHLPMPLLARIARLAPHLTTVDFSQVQGMSAETICLLVGFVDLAQILRERQGRFLGNMETPVACILTNYPVDCTKGGVRFGYAPQFVNSIDWRKKQVNITNAWNPRVPRHCLVPFRDLVSLNDQPSWTIGDVYFHTGYKSDAPSPTSLSKSIESYTGLKVGEDHVFDLASKPSIIQGKRVAITASCARVISSLLESINVNARQQCSHIVIDGPNAEDLLLGPENKVSELNAFSITMFSGIAQGPFTNVSRLSIICCLFMERNTVARIIRFLATGLPNLVDLDLRNVGCTMDRIMYHMDRLIRRTDKSPVGSGKPLKSLFVSAYVSCVSDARMSAPVTEAFERLTGIGRSHLDCTMATVGHLDNLTLELSGHGARRLDFGAGHGYGKENTLPAQTVGIHPGILHGIKHLRVDLVQLFILPPQHAKPSSPSFLPMSRIVHPGIWKGSETVSPRPLARRTVIPVFSHLVTLANLGSLSIHSHCLFPSTARDNHSATPRPTLAQPPPRSLQELLPRCPRLSTLSLHTNGPHMTHGFFARDSIPVLLSQFPELTFAQCVGFSKPARPLTIIRHIRGPRADPIAAQLLVLYPRQLSPCPKLRHVVVNFEPVWDYHELFGLELDESKKPDKVRRGHCCREMHGANAWLDSDSPDLDVD